MLFLQFFYGFCHGLFCPIRSVHDLHVCTTMNQYPKKQGFRFVQTEKRVMLIVSPLGHCYGFSFSVGFLHWRSLGDPTLVIQDNWMALCACFLLGLLDMDRLIRFFFFGFSYDYLFLPLLFLLSVRRISNPLMAICAALLFLLSLCSLYHQKVQLLVEREELYMNFLMTSLEFHWLTRRIFCFTSSFEALQISPKQDVKTVSIMQPDSLFLCILDLFLHAHCIGSYDALSGFFTHWDALILVI